MEDLKIVSDETMQRVFNMRISLFVQVQEILESITNFITQGLNDFKMISKAENGEFKNQIS